MAYKQAERVQPTQSETHRYKLGQAVNVESPLFPRPPGTCRITACLPPLGTHLQYRIKSDGEVFERVVAEHQITPIEAA